MTNTAQISADGGVARSETCNKACKRSRKMAQPKQTRVRRERKGVSTARAIVAGPNYQSAGARGRCSHRRAAVDDMSRPKRIGEGTAGVSWCTRQSVMFSLEQTSGFADKNYRGEPEEHQSLHEVQAARSTAKRNSIGRVLKKTSLAS